MLNILQILCCLLLLLGIMAPACDGDKYLKKDMILTSAAFKQGEPIPVIYTCKGEELSPPLSWNNIPPNTLSLALVVKDPDTTHGTFVHWVAWNIDPKRKELPENIKEDAPETLMMQGTNGALKIGYKGPCPPSGTHRYYFILYALDAKLDLKKSANIAKFDKAIEGHVIEEAQLMGTFKHVL